MAGKSDKNKLNDIALALVLMLSFLVSWMIKVNTSYSVIPENPGGLYLFDHSLNFAKAGRFVNVLAKLCPRLIKTMVLILPTYIRDKTPFCQISYQ